MSMLEKGEACVAFSSGMGAIAATFWTFTQAGGHILADKTLYGCTYALLSHGMTKFGVDVTFIDMSNLDEIANLKSNTAIVYLETPANPNLKLVDIEAISKIAKEITPAAKVVMDTFSTTIYHKPYSFRC